MYVKHMNENQDIYDAIELIHKHHLRSEASLTIQRFVRNTFLMRHWLLL